MSNEQRKYINYIKRQKVLIKVIQIFLIIFILGIWQIASQKEVINPFIYSSPYKVFKTIINLIKTHNLFNHVFCTLKEITISFMLGSFLGLLFAVILYEVKILAKIIEPFLITLNSLPKIALGPMIIIIAGANIKSVIVMALLINLIITIMNIYNGFLNVDNSKVTLLLSFKASKYQMLKYLIFPSSFNTIITALKINISMTLIGVIMGEFLVSKEGIGYLIIYGTQIFDMNLVMAGILVLVIISILIYLLVNKVLKNN